MQNVLGLSMTSLVPEISNPDFDSAVEHPRANYPTGTAVTPE